MPARVENGTVAPPGGGAADAVTVDDTGRVAELERRVLSLERALELSVAELSRVHASRWWRAAATYWRWRAWWLSRLRWVLHPLDSLRAEAPRVLPPRLRLRLLAVLAPLRRTEARDGGWGEAVSRRPAEESAAVPTRPAILCLPVIEWRFRRQRPQHLLTRLAARGWPVWYAAMKPASGARRAEAGEALDGGVRELSLPSIREIDPYREVLDVRSRDLMVSGLEAFFAERRVQELVVLCQLPFWRPLAARLRERLGATVVYDLLDLHGGFETNAAAMVAEEERLVAEADLVVATSSALERSAKATARALVRVPNGCDVKHWSNVEARPLPPGVGRPVIGYFGAIAEWFDADLVAEIALRRPEWSLVLVGSTYGGDVARLRGLPNVHLLGEQPYELLPGIAAGFDAGIIPFRDTPLTRATDPVKVYEMLALGLEVVATPLPEVVALRGLVRVAGGAEAFVAAIEAALRAAPASEVVEARRAFARASSWDERVSRLETAIVERFPLVSVVVVTYNNLPLTRMCLDSLFAHTEYPRWEAIVVDNGSTDGTVEALREATAARSELRLIENADNRGFAAANNQAVAEARGDILCLLNNDTVVPPGWLSPLVRALRRDPGLGLVGPVTNKIGNQAQIAVGYADVETMPAWAAGFMAEHRDEAFDIPMLALFCAALRRDVWERVGGLDERFGIGMFEDDDFCRRIRQSGYGLRCVRGSFVHHWQRASFRLLGEQAYQELFERNRAAFLEKWGR
ncbi:MAG: glycosyltransferase [Acidobacteriota bacterium]